jgi:hypothetical protein
VGVQVNIDTNTQYFVILFIWKIYIADISYKKYFFLYLFKKCDKMHNFMHYVQILLKLMP